MFFIKVYTIINQKARKKQKIDEHLGFLSTEGKQQTMLTNNIKFNRMKQKLLNINV